MKKPTSLSCRLTISEEALRTKSLDTILLEGRFNPNEEKFYLKGITVFYGSFLPGNFQFRFKKAAYNVFFYYSSPLVFFPTAYLQDQALEIDAVVKKEGRRFIIEKIECIRLAPPLIDLPRSYETPVLNGSFPLISGDKTVDIRALNSLIRPNRLSNENNLVALERLKKFYSFLSEGNPEFLCLFQDLENMGAIDYQKFYSHIISSTPNNTFSLPARLLLKQHLFNLIEFTCNYLHRDFLSVHDVIHEIHLAREANDEWIAFLEEGSLLDELLTQYDFAQDEQTLLRLEKRLVRYVSRMQRLDTASTTEPYHALSLSEEKKEKVHQFLELVERRKLTRPILSSRPLTVTGKELTENSLKEILLQHNLKHDQAIFYLQDITVFYKNIESEYFEFYFRREDSPENELFSYFSSSLLPPTTYLQNHPVKIDAIVKKEGTRFIIQEIRWIRLAFLQFEPSGSYETPVVNHSLPPISGNKEVDLHSLESLKTDNSLSEAHYVDGQTRLDTFYALLDRGDPQFLLLFQDLETRGAINYQAFYSHIILSVARDDFSLATRRLLQESLFNLVELTCNYLEQAFLDVHNVTHEIHLAREVNEERIAILEEERLPAEQANLHSEEVVCAIALSSAEILATDNREMLKEYYQQIVSQTLQRSETIEDFFSALSCRRLEELGCTVLDYAIKNDCLMDLIQLLENHADIGEGLSLDVVFFTNPVFMIGSYRLSLVEIALLFGKPTDITYLFQMIEARQIPQPGIANLENFTQTKESLLRIGDNYKQLVDIAQSSACASAYLESLKYSQQILTLFLRSYKLVSTFTQSDYERFPVSFLSAYARQIYLEGEHVPYVTPALLQALRKRAPHTSESQRRFCAALKRYLVDMLSSTDFEPILKSEYQFGCWFADIAIFIKHRQTGKIIKCLVVEYDGKDHDGKHDAQRDGVLLNIFKWTVKRFVDIKQANNVGDFFEEVRQDILTIIRDHSVTSEHHRKIAEEIEEPADEDAEKSSEPICITPLELIESNEFDSVQWQRFQAFIKQNPTEQPAPETLQACLTKLINYPDCDNKEFGWLVDFERNQLIDFFMYKMLDYIDQHSSLNLNRKEFNTALSTALQAYPHRAKPKKSSSSLDELISMFFVEILQAYLYQPESLNRQALDYVNLVFQLFTQEDQELLGSSRTVTCTTQNKYVTIIGCVQDNFSQLEKLYRASSIRDSYFFNERPTVTLLAMLNTLGLSVRKDQIQANAEGVIITTEATMCEIVFSSEEGVLVKFSDRLLEGTPEPSSGVPEDSLIITHLGEEVFSILHAALLIEQPNVQLTREIVDEVYIQLKQELVLLEVHKNQVAGELAELNKFLEEKKKPRVARNTVNLNVASSEGIKERKGRLQKNLIDLKKQIETRESLLDYLQDPKRKQPDLSLVLSLLKEKARVVLPKAEQPKHLTVQSPEMIITRLNDADSAADQCSQLMPVAILQLLERGECNIKNRQRNRTTIISLELVLRTEEGRNNFLRRCNEISVSQQWKEGDVKKFLCAFKENTNKHLKQVNVFDYCPLKKQDYDALAIIGDESRTALFKTFTEKELIRLINQLYPLWHQFKESKTIKNVWKTLVEVICEAQGYVLLDLTKMLSDSYYADQKSSRWFELAHRKDPTYELLVTTVLSLPAMQPNSTILEYLPPIFGRDGASLLHEGPYVFNFIVKCADPLLRSQLVELVFRYMDIYRNGEFCTGLMVLAENAPELCEYLVLEACKLKQKDRLAQIYKALVYEFKGGPCLGYWSLAEYTPKAFLALVTLALTTEYTEMLHHIAAYLCGEDRADTDAINSSRRYWEGFYASHPDVMEALIKRADELDQFFVLERIIEDLSKKKDEQSLPYSRTFYKLLIKWANKKSVENASLLSKLLDFFLLIPSGVEIIIESFFIETPAWKALAKISAGLFEQLIVQACQYANESLFKEIIDGLTKVEDHSYFGWLAFIEHLPERTWSLIETVAETLDDDGQLLRSIQEARATTSTTLNLFNAFMAESDQQPATEDELDAFLSNLESKQSDAECIAWMGLTMHNPKAYVLLIEKVIKPEVPRLFRLFLAHPEAYPKKVAKTGWQIIAEYSVDTLGLIVEYAHSSELFEPLLASLKVRRATSLASWPSIDSYRQLLEKACEPGQTILCDLITKELTFSPDDIPAFPQKRAWNIVHTQDKNLCSTVVDVADQHNHIKFMHTIIESFTYSIGWRILATESKEIFERFICRICEPQHEDLFRLMIKGLQEQEAMGCAIGWVTFVHDLSQKSLDLIEERAGQLEDDSLVANIAASLTKAKEIIGALEVDSPIESEPSLSPKLKVYAHAMQVYLEIYPADPLSTLMRDFIKNEERKQSPMSSLSWSLFSAASAASRSTTAHEVRVDPRPFVCSGPRGV